MEFNVDIARFARSGKILAATCAACAASVSLYLASLYLIDDPTNPSVFARIALPISGAMFLASGTGSLVSMGGAVAHAMVGHAGRAFAWFILAGTVMAVCGLVGVLFFLVVFGGMSV